MYASSFGLTERPFSITPNPRYLFLSKRHREALAHLLYGVREGGGFVQLTGEVGTGKTMLCRTLLEQLPENVDLALIFNPKVSPIELVATICDELDIEYPEGNQSIKVLTDRLNRYLLDAHTKGRRVVVVIDEAQNLEVDVLEQVRLLTNLETASQKLLQIILVGQPELKEILAKQELRQVAQRITARYHLVPLSLEETEGYIKHRLTVGGARKMLFSNKAIKLVHRYSKGVPRLVNIICDRALLGAFAKDLTHVNERVLKKAAREVLAETWKSGPWFVIRSWFGKRSVQFALGAGAAALLLVLLVPRLVSNDSKVKVQRASLPDLPSVAQTITLTRSAEPVKGKALSADQLAPKAAQIANAAPTSASAEVVPVAVVPVPTSIDAVAAMEAAEPTAAQPALDKLLTQSNKSDAVADLASTWGVDLATAGPIQCDNLAQFQLVCDEKKGTWNNLKRLNRPAVLTLVSTDGTKFYGVILSMQENEVTFRVGLDTYHLDKNFLDNLWYGDYLIVWRLPALQRAIIKPGTEGDDIVWLREQIQKIEGVGAQSDKPAYFDAVLGERVRNFQRRYGLDEDGVVGLQTLMYLNNLAADENVPSLMHRTSP